MTVDKNDNDEVMIDLAIDIMKDDLKSKYAPIHQHCVKWLQELKELRKTVKCIKEGN